MRQREEELRARQQEANEERKRQNKLDEDAKAQRLDAIHARRRDVLEERRVRAPQKQQKQKVAFDRIQAIRRSELEELAQANAQKQQLKKETRETRDADTSLAKRTKYEDAQSRSAAYRRSMIIEADRRRREEALNGLIWSEEHCRASERLTNQRVACSVESQRRYEMRLTAIEERELSFRRMQIESQKMRDELERKKAELEAGVISPSDIAKKGPGKLSAVAEKFGIDLPELKEKARTYRRGRSQISTRHSPPPAARTL
jgi:hypothetical protein